ncbi:MAG: hypothetical protein QMD77_04520 [Patescibacteria group bacterium]|nr:hypothetical protein [Patescibacteria group bacterium]
MNKANPRRNLRKSGGLNLEQEMQFYHNLTTEKSFKFLQELKKKHNFILIGGWAVYLYTRALKSKDIDIVVDYDQLAKLKEIYDVFKNDRLKKYEIKTGEFDVDIYLPHYSDLGISVRMIHEKTNSLEGFTVPELELLFLLKLHAWRARRGSVKGRKDELDVFSLAFLSEFDWKKFLKMAEEFGLENYADDFFQLLKREVRIEEMDINEQKMARIKKDILKKAIQK